MRLAKPQLDIGLYTNQRQPQLEFWQHTVGLEFDHLGKLGGGVHQLRHHCGGSIIKVNHSRDALDRDKPTGMVGLVIGREECATRLELHDPDGNAVALVPKDDAGPFNLALRLQVRDVSVSAAFYRDGLGLSDLGYGRFACGQSQIWLEQDALAPVVGALPGVGLRYFTLQIFDCDRAHGWACARGGTEGRPPRTLGDTVRYSFVRDPDGNWIELSERASLVGGLVPRDRQTGTG